MPKKNVEQSFSVSFNFRYRKILCIRGVGHDDFSNIFCPTRPKKIVEESLRFHLISGIEKVYA